MLINTRKENLLCRTDLPGRKTTWRMIGKEHLKNNQKITGGKTIRKKQLDTEGGKAC